MSNGKSPISDRNTRIRNRIVLCFFAPALVLILLVSPAASLARHPFAPYAIPLAILLMAAGMAVTLTYNRLSVGVWFPGRPKPGDLPRPRQPFKPDKILFLGAAFIPFIAVWVYRPIFAALGLARDGALFYSVVLFTLAVSIPCLSWLSRKIRGDKS